MEVFLQRKIECPLILLSPFLHLDVEVFERDETTFAPLRDEPIISKKSRDVPFRSVIAVKIVQRAHPPSKTERGLRCEGDGGHCQTSIDISGEPFN